MQPLACETERGVVQWVDPRPVRPKKHTQSSRDASNSSSFSDVELVRPSDCENELDDLNIDPATCKTVCMFIDEHLRELREHQKAINAARSKLLKLNYDGQVADDGSFISHGDVLRLKVRDEQTKTTETIKQLTNYLRELSCLKKYEIAGNRSPADEEIIHRLTNIRINIVQALNDFVLNNTDIDVPIVDSEDFSFRDYDLCIDAQTSVQISDNLKDSTSSQNKLADFLINSDPPSVVNIDINHPDQEQKLKENHRIDLEKRKREIQKLEKDTVELRQLFSEFYTLVKQQNESIDTIEHNIVIATQRIHEGQNNVNKTKRTLTVLVPFTGCMAGALIGGPIGLMVGGKIGGVTFFCASSLLGLITSLSAQRCMTPDKIKRR